MARTRRPKHGERARLGSRGLAAGSLALAGLVLALAVRIETEATPPLAIRGVIRTSVRIAGEAPALAWPGEGEAAVEVEGLGGLGRSGGTTPVPIASVAKVMTAYLTLRRYPLAPGQDGFRMTVTAAEVSEERERASLGQSILPVSAGERLTERQALEALLLPSANNIAAMLAAHDAGSIAAFVSLMNTTARKLHMDSTTYTDPSGFDDSTVSTAEDQLKLARVAIGVQAFASIVSERSAELPLAGVVANLDGLLGKDGYVGVKTGSDRAAGGCLVFAKHLTVAGRHLTVLGVVLGQRMGSLIGAALAGAARLGDSAAAAVRLETVLPAGATALSVRSADGSRTVAVLAGPVEEVGWGGLSLRAQVIPRRRLFAVRVGEIIGNVILSGARRSTSTAVAAHSLSAPGLGWRIRHIL